MALSPDAAGGFNIWGFKAVNDSKQSVSPNWLPTTLLSNEGLSVCRAILRASASLSSHRLLLLDEVLCPDDAKAANSVLSLREAHDCWDRLCSSKLDGLGVYNVFVGASGELSESDVKLFRTLCRPPPEVIAGLRDVAVTSTTSTTDHRSTDERKRYREDEEAFEPTAAVVPPTAASRVKPTAVVEKHDSRKPDREGVAAGPVPGTSLPVPRYATLPVDYRSHGTDKIPVGPIDPEHPQRVADCSIDKVVRRMSKYGGGVGKITFIADTKFDGERLIVHKEGAAYHFFSRNMLAVPERKLDHVRDAFTKAFGDNSVLLDCEILSKHTFGSMNKVKKHELGDGAKFPIRVYVFDILWINGHNIQSLPLTSRRMVQRHVLRVSPNLVEHADTVTVTASDSATAAAQLQKCFDVVMGGKLEGLVVKPADSPYSNGGTHWVKLKRDYIPTTSGPTPTTAERTFAGTTVTRFVVKNVPKGPTAIDFVGVNTDTGAGGDTLASTTGDLKLSDTVDLLVVGRLKDGQLLVASLDKGTDASHRNVIVAVVKDPSGLCRHYLTTGDSTTTTSASSCTFVRWPPAFLETPAATTSDWRLVGTSTHRDKCPVVEVAASKIVERVSCPHIALLDDALNWTLSPDATVTRLREDKSPADVTPLSALKALVSEATLRATRSFEATCQLASENTVDVDFDGADDDEWEDAKAIDRLVRRTPNAMLATVSGYLTSKKPPVGAAIFVLVPVARERFWSDRGLMGEVTSTLGPAPKTHCDSVIARKTCRPGSIVVSEVTWGEASPFHCAVVPMAVLDFPDGGRKPTLALLQATTALRRLRHLCISVARGSVGSPSNGCNRIIVAVKEEDITAGLVPLLRRIVLGPVSRECETLKVAAGAFGIELQLHKS